MRKKDYKICSEEETVCFNCFHYHPEPDAKLKDADFSNDGECFRYPVITFKPHTGTCGEFKSDE